MASAKAQTRTRKSAEERREELVDVALRHFADGGYHGTSTEAIAREAGISQPYLFRLFGTKRELFLACHEANHLLIRKTFETAAEGLSAEARMPAMGHAYVNLLADRRLLLFQMQTYAACADPVIQAQVRERYGQLVALVGELTGAPAPVVWNFFATGMLLNVVASLDLEAIACDDDWAASWAQPGELLGLG